MGKYHANGSYLGSVDANGRIYDDRGNYLGSFRTDGYIYDSSGNHMGQIDQNGYIYDSSGNHLGSVWRHNGHVYDSRGNYRGVFDEDLVNYIFGNSQSNTLNDDSSRTSSSQPISDGFSFDRRRSGNTGGSMPGQLTKDTSGEGCATMLGGVIGVAFLVIVAFLTVIAMFQEFLKMLFSTDVFMLVAIALVAAAAAVYFTQSNKYKTVLFFNLGVTEVFFLIHMFLSSAVSLSNFIFVILLGMSFGVFLSLPSWGIATVLVSLSREKQKIIAIISVVVLIFVYVLFNYIIEDNISTTNNTSITNNVSTINNITQKSDIYDFLDGSWKEVNGSKNITFDIANGDIISKDLGYDTSLLVPPYKFSSMDFLGEERLVEGSVLAGNEDNDEGLPVNPNIEYIEYNIELLGTDVNGEGIDDVEFIYCPSDFSGNEMYWVCYAGDADSRDIIIHFVRD